MTPDLRNHGSDKSNHPPFFPVTLSKLFAVILLIRIGAIYIRYFKHTGSKRESKVIPAHLFGRAYQRA
jgi:hypothetical protein